MNTVRLIHLPAAVTLIELMLTTGLGATVAELRAVARDWGSIVRVMIASYVLVPAAAVAVSLLFRATIGAVAVPWIGGLPRTCSSKA